MTISKHDTNANSNLTKIKFKNLIDVKSNLFNVEHNYPYFHSFQAQKGIAKIESRGAGRNKDILVKR